MFVVIQQALKEHVCVSLPSQDSCYVTFLCVTAAMHQVVRKSHSTEKILVLTAFIEHTCIFINFQCSVFKLRVMLLFQKKVHMAQIFKKISNTHETIIKHTLEYCRFSAKGVVICAFFNVQSLKQNQFLLSTDKADCYITSMLNAVAYNFLRCKTSFND